MITTVLRLLYQSQRMGKYDVMVVFFKAKGDI
jgi:hypothetical protein